LKFVEDVHFLENFLKHVESVDVLWL
jgi:hypothetical protein